MKTIAETVSLAGQSEQITVSEFRAKPGEVFSQVEMGKEFTVSRNGAVIAEIKKPESFDWRALQQLRKMSP